MKYQILFHPQAKIELFESKKWYAERSLTALRKFQLEISTLLALLAKDPFIFQISYSTKRRANLNKFPYSLVYTIQDDTVFILSFFHHSRNPNIWKKR